MLDAAEPFSQTSRPPINACLQTASIKVLAESSLCGAFTAASTLGPDRVLNIDNVRRIDLAHAAYAAET